MIDIPDILKSLCGDRPIEPTPDMTVEELLENIRHNAEILNREKPE